MRFNTVTTILLLSAAALMLSACGSTSNTGSTTTATASATASTASGSLSINQFYPAAGNVASVPSYVQLSMSESSLDQSSDSGSVTYSENYTLVCNSQTYYASSVSYNGSGVVTVYLPSVSGLSSGTVCAFEVSSNIHDTSGNYISGTLSVNYTLSSGSSGVLGINSFSPASSTVSSLPSSVQVNFNETNIDVSSDSYSALNTSNYTVNCGSGTYYVSSVTNSGSGIVYVTMPSLSVSAGSTCVLTASGKIHDTNGYALSGTTTVSYYFSSSSSTSTWNEQSNTTTEGPAGVATGTTFYDKGSNGIALSGLNIHSGGYVDQITGIWEVGFTSGSSQAYGPTHGGSGGSSNVNVMCPAGEQITGVFGTYSGEITSLGIICGLPGYPQAAQSSAYGGGGGTSFQINCPSGEFATDLAGYSGSYLEEIQLGCR